MGLKLGGIMLEGNHLDDVPGILKAYDLSVEDSLAEVDPGFRIWEEAGRTYYLVALCGDWTVIVDPEVFMLATAEDTCADLSRRFNCRCIGFILYDVSASYWLLVFDKGKLTRRFAYDDGSMTCEGEPLPEEAGSDEERPDEKVLHALRGLGVNLLDLHRRDAEVLEEADRLFLCHSAESTSAESANEVNSRSKRPWWKFW
jgi:hypothetical protein